MELIVLVLVAAGAADGMLLGIEPAGIHDDTSYGSVKLVQLMVLQMVQSSTSRMVQLIVVQMMVLCLAWSSMQPMEHQMVPCLTMLLLLVLKLLIWFYCEDCCWC